MGKHRGGKIKSSHKEGASSKRRKDDSTHQTEWYDTGAGSSHRVSRDVDAGGNVSEEHTTQQK